MSDFIKIYNSRFNADASAAEIFKNNGEKIRQFIDKAYVSKYYYHDKDGDLFKRSKGISLHIPAISKNITYETWNGKKYTEVQYKNLAFVKNGSWEKFLKWAYNSRSNK